MAIRTLLPLSGSTNLYQFAKEVTGLPHAHRTELFKFPSFRREFYALPEVEQDKLWAQLAVHQNGVPRDLVPRAVLDQEYAYACRFPAQLHSEYLINRAFELHCPHWYLREQLAIRFEDALKTSGDFMRGRITSYTNPDTGQSRKRIFYADSLSNDWCHFMRRTFINDLPLDTYAIWLDDKRFPLLMVHERNAAELRSRGESIGAAHLSMLCHPSSIEASKPTPTRQKPMAPRAERPAQPTKTERQLDLFGDWSD